MKFSHCFLLILMMPFTLLGCSGMNSQFTCPQQPGIMCHSLGQVNALVDQDKIAQVDGSVHRNQWQSSKNISITTLTPTSCTPEKILRIWVAPYVDHAGHYHEASRVYAVV